MAGSPPVPLPESLHLLGPSCPWPSLGLWSTASTSAFPRIHLPNCVPVAWTVVTSHACPKDKVSPPNSSREPGPSQLTPLLGQAPAAFLLCSPLRSRLHPSHRSSASLEPLLAPQEARTAGSPQKGMASQRSTGIFQLTRTVIG